MHEEDFWCSWLREDEQSEEESKGEAEEKEKKRRKKRMKRGRLKEDVKDFVSVEAFEIFSQGRDVESCGDVSWEDLWEEPEDLSGRELVSVELVRVAPSSVVTELCDVSPCGSDWEFVKPQSFSFSKKRAHCGTDTQEEMEYEGSPVEALPLSNRRSTPLMQNSCSSFVRDHGRNEEEG